MAIDQELLVVEYFTDLDEKALNYPILKHLSANRLCEEWLFDDHDSTSPNALGE